MIYRITYAKDGGGQNKKVARPGQPWTEREEWVSCARTGGGRHTPSGELDHNASGRRHPRGSVGSREPTPGQEPSMESSTIAVSAADGTPLHTYRWLPDGPPRAIP